MREKANERAIIRAFGLPIDEAIEIVGRVGVGNMLKDQIDGDDIIIGTDVCAICLTTKNRKSIGIDVWKPKVATNNDRANCYTIG